MTAPWSVLLVGCGNIAGKFDEGKSFHDAPMTHAGAYLASERFQLMACVEPCAERRRLFAQAWSIPAAYEHIDAVHGSFDVISICSPTQQHADHVRQAIDLRPRLIFCEKPLANDLKEAEYLVKLCEERGVRLVVNYTRRWAPDVQRFKADLQAQRWGVLRSVQVIYNKGIVHNGGHWIDLLHDCHGPLQLHAVGKPVFDFFSDDPTVPVLLRIAANDCPVTVGIAHAADYALFELQWVFSEAVITMEAGGLRWRRRFATVDERFSGYRCLNDIDSVDGEYGSAMLNAVKNIDAVLMDQGEILSTGHTALQAQRLSESIRSKAIDYECSSTV